MKRLLIHGPIVIAVSLVATMSAYALDYPCADNETSCGGSYFEGDETAGGHTGGTGSKWYGGEYISCQAKGNRGQTCWDRTLDAVTKKPECSGVWHWASCGCHMETKELIGICVFNK